MPFISPTSASLALPVSPERLDELRQQFTQNAYVICSRALSAERAGALRQRALDIVQRHARPIEQRSGEHVLRYRVVTGEVVRTEWPELFAMYRSAELREWVAAIAGLPTVFNSSHLQSALNINALGEPGEIYRWHHDAAGLTLLLYLSDSRKQDGGALEMRASGAVETMLPTAGTVVLMDGTRCLHRVSPIVRRHQRISVPMVFTPDPDHERPAGLDDYLYRA
ncbi:MAG: 2OG-Fe(II) oxygenase [Acidobacteriota bacterium]|nr:2OG-Fe(II) oxygenase [Acidobacteriota bacterium]